MLMLTLMLCFMPVKLSVLFFRIMEILIILYSVGLLYNIYCIITYNHNLFQKINLRD